MDLTAYREEIKFKLSGGVLELEIEDAQIDKIIDAALREVQRYIDTVALKTIKYQSCIDLSDMKVNDVTAVYRSSPLATTTNANGITDYSSDPMYLMQWQMLSGGGTMLNFSDYALNYMSYATMNQIQNTLSTDLAYYYDKPSEKLYINIANGTPNEVTIAYVPRFDDVSQITSDYWIDILMRLSVALAKTVLGRIRSRYKQSNALWEQDGETMLAEGTEELNAIRESLQANSQLVYGID